jgi:hypothetical protein
LSLKNSKREIVRIKTNKPRRGRVSEGSWTAVFFESKKIKRVRLKKKFISLTKKSHPKKTLIHRPTMSTASASEAPSSSNANTTIGRKRNYQEITADLSQVLKVTPEATRQTIVPLVKELCDWTKNVVELAKTTCQSADCKNSFLGRPRIVTISVGRRNEYRAAIALCPSCVDICPRCQTECAKSELREVGMKRPICFDCATGSKMPVPEWDDDAEEDDNEDDDLKKDADFNGEDEEGGDEPPKKRQRKAGGSAKAKTKSKGRDVKTPVLANNKPKGKMANGRKKTLAMPQFGSELMSDLTTMITSSKEKRQQDKKSKAPPPPPAKKPAAVAAPVPSSSPSPSPTSEEAEEEEEDGNNSEELEELSDDEDEAQVRADEAAEDEGDGEGEGGEEGDDEEGDSGEEQPAEEPAVAMSDA